MIRDGKGLSWTAVGVATLAIAVGVVGVAIAVSADIAKSATTVSCPQTNTPPINDNYLCSLALNAPGTKLNSTDTLEDRRNTTGATVQSDLFNPPASGGPPEVATCRGVNYGATIWYDFYPNANGIVQIQTSGFNNVITLYSFSPTTVMPDAAGRKCVHTSSFPSEELVASVKKGRDYTIQIGGVDGPSGPAAGPLQFLFDYILTPPHRLTASATLKALAVGNGIEILGLTVSTARAARVEVKCGHRCRPEAMSDKSVESFPKLHGVRMPAGSKLDIFVTAKNSIGVLIQYNILPGNFTKEVRCLEPGSRKPRRSCH